MSDLPSGWVRSTLGGVASWSSGGTPKSGAAAYYGGEIPWAVIGDLNDSVVGTTTASITKAGLANSSAKVVAAGTVLVAMYGSIGKLGIAEMPMATNQAIACAVPSRVVSRYWLFWWLRSQRTALLGAGKGGTQANISQTVLKSWPIPVAPLAEQERIVGAIEEAFSKLDAGEAGLRTVRRLLKRIRDSVLAAAVTGGPVSQHLDDTAPARLLAHIAARGDGSMGDLPSGWLAITLGDVLQTIEAGKSFASQGRPARDGEVGVIKVSAMTWGEFRPGENKALPPGTPIEPSWVVRAGDLLLSRANTQEYVGACVLVPVDHPDLILSDKSLRLVPTDGIERRWLLHALRSHQARTQIEQLATGTKDSMRNISQAKLRTLRLSLPPIEEQRRIADEVERQFSFIEACERAVDAGLARSAALRRSVLKSAFEGRLVPPDPSDEPASALLERIRTSRVPTKSAAPPPRRTA